MRSTDTLVSVGFFVLDITRRVPSNYLKHVLSIKEYLKFSSKSLELI